MIRYFFLCSVFIVTCTKIVDTDAWLHLSLGRLIWETKGFPELEVFPYTNNNAPFLYTSWLFGLLCYLVSCISDRYGLVLMVATVVTATFYILYKDSTKQYRGDFLPVLVLFGTFVISRYFWRITLRPDTFLMFFLAFTIFSLNSYLDEGKKYLYILPLIICIWANSHSSIILMVIPFIAFLGGGMLTLFFKKNSINSISKDQLKIIAIIFILSIFSVFMSPNTIDQILYGASTLSSDLLKSSIAELRTPKGNNLILNYSLISLLIFSFILNIKRFSLIHFSLILPFTILPFIAVRFIFLLPLVGGPVLVRNIGLFLNNKKMKEFFPGKIKQLCTVVVILLFTLLNIAQVSPFSSSLRDRIGFGYNYSRVPKNAVEYMDKNRIYGRVLNEPHFGQYIIWTGFPKRNVFSDARFQRPDLIEKADNSLYVYSELNKLYNMFGFSSILIPNDIYLNKSLDNGIHQNVIFRHPEWALVFWDDVSSLYLKRDRYPMIVQRDEYRFFSPDVSMDSFIERLNDSQLREKIGQDLKRNIDETGSVFAHIFLGIVYDSAEKYDEALTTLFKVKNTQTKYSSILFTAMGDTYYNKKDFKNSILFYEKALDFKDRDDLIPKLGDAYFFSGEHEKALALYLKAIKENGNPKLIYPYLIATYEALGQLEKANTTKEKFQALQTMKQ